MLWSPPPTSHGLYKVLLPIPFLLSLASSFAVFLSLFSPSDHHFPLGPPFCKGGGGSYSTDEAISRWWRKEACVACHWVTPKQA